MAVEIPNGYRRNDGYDEDGTPDPDAMAEDNLPTPLAMSPTKRRVVLADEPSSYGSFASESEVAEQEDENEEVEEDEEDSGPSYLTNDGEALREHHRRRMRDDNDIQNRAAEDAVIEEVTCVNFMCHSHLTIKPGPLINFITGHNGSGKSAVLTALVLCLGGKAAATNRGGSLKNFIKEGRAQANLIVRIKNHGNGAYRPEVFGRSVIVERHFSRTSGSGYKLKSTSGKVISTKREELDTLLQFFALQMDNPINVLSQDMARQFLNSSSPVDKYRLFVKGTRIDQLESDYRAISDSIEKSMLVQNEIKTQIEELKDKSQQAHKKLERLDTQRKLEDRIQSTMAQMCWLSVAAEEDQLKELERTLENIDNEVLAHQRDAEKANQGILQLQDQIIQVKAEYQTCANNERLGLEDEKTTHSVRLLENGKKLGTIMSDQRIVRSDFQNALNDIAKTQAAIAAETRKIEQRNGSRPAELAERIKELSDEIDALARQKSEILSDKSKHDNSFQEAQRSLAEAKDAVIEKETAVNARKRQIDNLDRGRSNTFMQTELDSVLRAIHRDRNKFNSVPIGPFFKHITLLDQKWSSMLESFAGPAHDAFCVTTKRDQEALYKIFREARYHPPPRVFILANGPRYNIESYKPARSLNVKTWPDVVRIDNDTVFNCLVQQLSFEHIVLMDTWEEARDFASRCHENVSRVFAYHEDQVVHRGKGTIFTPSGTNPLDAWKRGPRMMANVQDQKRHQESLLAAEQVEVRTAREATTTIQKAISSAKIDVRQCSDQADKLGEQIRKKSREKDKLTDELETINLNSGADIGALEDQLKKAKDDLEAAKSGQEACESERQELLDKKQEIQAELDKVLSQLSRVDKNLEKLKQKQTLLEQQAGNLSLEKAQAQTDANRKENSKQDYEEKRKEQEEIVNNYTTEATSVSQRIPIPRGETVESLKKKKDKLEEDLKRAQAQQGGSAEELKAAANKIAGEYKRKKKQFDTGESVLHQLKSSLLTREGKLNTSRGLIARTATAQFKDKLSMRNFNGNLKFDHRQRTLNLTVEPEISRTDSNGRQTKTLSGGEKSFSTICLLLALWDSISSPIRCLDEFDVFMDSINRQISMDMLIKAANLSIGRQFIFITPQAMGNIVPSQTVRIHKMSDPERGQGTLVEAS